MRSRVSDPAASRPRPARAPQPVPPDTPGPGHGRQRFESDATIGDSLDQTDPGLFDCGTLLKLRLHGLGAEERVRNTVFRACFVVLLGWLPLLLLTAYQTIVVREAGMASFLSDFAVACRSLIAAPVLVLAELVCLPRLSAIALHFRESGIVSKADDARFAAACASTVRLRSSIAADIGLIVLAYVVIAALMETVPLSLYPAWQLSAFEGSTVYSPAGWWHALVSLPLLFILLLSWIWRLALWTRFLYLMSRLDLRLVPAHPDRTAGLRFVAYSVQAFSLVAFGLGVVVAGSAANRILYARAPLVSLEFAVIGLVAAVIVVFAGPLLTFSGHLLRAWRRGTLQYSALAGRLGRQFEGKWFRNGAAVDASSFELPDFSATTDLYQVASNVYEVRLIPISVASLGILVAMAIAPFLVIVLMFIPFDQIVAEIAKLLL